MTGGILRRFPAHAGRSIATLYFLNSLGGAIGVLTSGFWLIKWLGLPGTIALAGTLNLLLAGIVAKLSMREPESAVAAPQPQKDATIERRLVLFLLVSGLTGLSSFIYEVSWIRMLGLALGSSTHAFELMLSAFILGLALGGWWMRKRIDAIAGPEPYLGWVQVIMGISALATLPLYSASFNLVGWLMDSVTKSDAGYLQFSIASHTIAMVIMLPAAFCAGMTLPLITHSLLRAGCGERSIGLVYGANTIGAIAGVMLAVHVGLPLLGLKNLMLAGASIDIVLGLFLLWRFAPNTRTLATATGAGVAMIAVALGLFTLDPYRAASGVFRASQKLLNPDTTRMVFHQDGKTATVSLLEYRNEPLRVIRTNGKTDASINYGPRENYRLDEVTMTLTGAIPLLLNPTAGIAANVGIGSGLTSHVMLADPALRHLDTIEIEAKMIEASRGFLPRNENVFKDPRSHIAIEDAKSYFSTRRQPYGIIVSEPSNPWVSGISSLFSSEFYAHTRRHLAPGGIFLQWLQLYEIDESLVMSVMKAIDKSFADYAIFASNYADVLIVASADGPLPALPEQLPTTALGSELERVGILGSKDIRGRLVATRAMLRPLLDSQDIPANSDYFPVLDQNANRARFLGANAFKLALLPFEPLPLLDMLAANDPIVRRPEDPKAYSNSRNFGRPLPAAFAEYLKDRLEGSNPGQTVPGDASAGDFPARAAALIQACQVPPGGDHVYAVLEFALQLIPFLDRSDAATVSPLLSRMPCFADLTESDRDWANLVLAVGQRDASGMALFSQRLLAAKRDLSPARRKYLLATGLLGLVASGRKPMARDLWDRHGPLSFPAEVPLLYRLLLAHARS
jgi:predicted membrane-bound spermidine synthase